MRNFTFALLIVLSFTSCKKFKTIKDAESYFPNRYKVFNYKSVNSDLEFDFFYPTESVTNHYQLGQIRTEWTYCYFPSDSNSLGTDYSETYVIESTEDKIFFNILELHVDVCLEDVNYCQFKYDVAFSPYRLEILKNNLKLGDKWETNQNVGIQQWADTLSFNPPPTNIVNATFHYEVIGINEKMQIKETKYKNILAIKVDYKIGEIKSYKVYYFAKDIGLIYYSRQGVDFYLND